MAAYQNSTYYFSSSNLMTQPVCLRYVFLYNRPQQLQRSRDLNRLRRFWASPGQTSAWWDNFVCQTRTVSGSPANVLPSLSLRGSKDGANELYVAGDIAWGMHTEQ